MTNTDVYPCYLRIVPDVESDDIMELPSEANGTILLSTVTAQFANATGLKYKTESGTWRGVRLVENALHPPEDGWGEKEFFLTVNKEAAKRKMDSSSDGEPLSKKNKDDALLEDLIVLGLTYTATEEDLKKYFSKFGPLAMYEVKREQDGTSKGFGFIRFKDKEAARKVIKLNHNVGGRRCEVRLPQKMQGPDEIPAKLFIGRLKEGTTDSDLREHFSAYGDLTDVYVPVNFRGFGFVTFESQEAAYQVLETPHVIKGANVNVTIAEPKGGKGNSFMQQQHYSYGYNNFGQGFMGQQMGGMGQMGGYGAYNEYY